MGKIATEAEAFAIGEEGLISNETKGVTKLKADALGCDVKGSYSNQQLVQKDDLSSKYNKIRISLKGRTSLDGAELCIEDYVSYQSQH